MTKEEIIDGLEIYTVGRLKKARVYITVEELQGFIDEIKSLKESCEDEQSDKGQWILSGGYWRCSKCKEKALLKFDKSKGNCREYIPVKSNFCPNCGKNMSVI